MSTNPLRVGILGCAGIASKTVLAISNPATNCVVRAVASRSAEKAEVTIRLFKSVQYFCDAFVDDILTCMLLL
jgi:predicted dehydrogenase